MSTSKRREPRALWFDVAWVGVWIFFIVLAWLSGGLGLGLYIILAVPPVIVVVVWVQSKNARQREAIRYHHPVDPPRRPPGAKPQNAEDKPMSTEPQIWVRPKPLLANTRGPWYRCVKIEESRDPSSGLDVNGLPYWRVTYAVPSKDENAPDTMATALFRMERGGNDQQIRGVEFLVLSSKR